MHSIASEMADRPGAAPVWRACLQCSPWNPDIFLSVPQDLTATFGIERETPLQLKLSQRLMR